MSCIESIRSIPGSVNAEAEIARYAVERWRKSRPPLTPREWLLASSTAAS